MILTAYRFCRRARAMPRRRAAYCAVVLYRARQYAFRQMTLAERRREAS